MPTSTLTPPVPALLVRWREQCDAIADAELTTEEFAALATTYLAMRRVGHEFDPAVVALMTCLARQAMNTDDDSDSDTDVADQEKDDPDEDYSLPALPLWRETCLRRKGDR